MFRIALNALAILVLDKGRLTRHSRKAICEFAVYRYWNGNPPQ